MKYMIIKSRRYRIIKFIDLNRCDEFGYCSQDNTLYAGYKGERHIILDCSEIFINEEEGFALCEQIFEEYVKKSMTMDGMMIDMDSIIQNIMLQREIHKDIDEKK